MREGGIRAAAALEEEVPGRRACLRSAVGSSRAEQQEETRWSSALSLSCGSFLKKTILLFFE